MRSTLTWLTLGLASIFIINLSPAHGASWGESCAADPNACNDATTFLECDATEKKCLCQNRANSYFEQFDQKCHMVESATGCTIVGMPCPLNGACNPGTQPPKCQCRSGFYATTTKKCARRYQGVCSTDQQCDRDNFMACLPNTCICDSATSVYDADKGACVLKANQECAIATPNAQECTTGSTCTAQDGGGAKCVCDDGTSANDKGECRVNFGGPCNPATNQLCNEANFLICGTENKCVCKAPLTSNDDDVCVAGFDASCAAGETCDDRLFLACEDASKKCKCRSDLIENGANECKALYDKPCNVAGEPDCDLDNFLECSPANKCICKDGLTGSIDGLCRAGLGASCAAGEPCDEANFLTCNSDHMCACTPPLEAIDGICTAGFDESCAANEPCDAKLFLTCDPVNHKCACRAGTVDVGVVGDCRSTIDQPCGLNQPICFDGDFLFCTADVCKCRDDLVTNPENQCRAKLEMPCNLNTDPLQPDCDAANFLVCGANDNVCHCRADLSPNPSGQCTSKLGASCAAGEPQCDGTKFLICGKDETCECVQGFSDVDGICKAGFGISCANGALCDDKLFLECHQPDEICACRQGTIDLGGDQCQSLYNEACGTDKPACYATDFLECDTNDQCKCRPDLVDVDGVCKSGVDGSCDPADVTRPECDATNFLECDLEGDKNCHCKAGLSPVAGRCIAGFGATCAAGEPCDPSKFYECHEPDKTCQCQSTLVDLGGGNCQSKIGGTCGTDLPACYEADFLACAADGTCQCRPGLVNVEGSCEAKLGTTCGDNEPPCADSLYLICGAASTQCECKEGMADNGKGVCRVNFGAPCSTNEADRLVCDESIFVVCNELTKTCACAADSWYNKNDKICSLKEGASCNPDGGADPPPQACGVNSHCIGSGVDDAVCKCEGDLIGNNEGRCFLGAGQFCNPDDDHCDLAEFQECNEETYHCACVITEDTVEESAGRCRIRAEGICEPKPEAQQCTTNSECRKVVDEYLCMCSSGLIPNSVGKCVLTYGAYCGQESIGSCDYEGFQTCHHELGECTCFQTDTMFYDRDTHKCYIRVGSACVDGSMVKCGENAKCELGACACIAGYEEDSHGVCVPILAVDGSFFGIFWRAFPFPADRQNFSH